MGRIANKEAEIIEKRLKDGWKLQKIAVEVGVSYPTLKKFINQRAAAKEAGTMPVAIVRELEKSGTFGKFCRQTREFIKDLYAVGVNSQVVGELLGLGFAPSKENSDTGGFYELQRLSFKDECKQAQAIKKVELMIAAQTDPKPIDALRFLTANESTRSMYKAPKEDNERKIEIIFPGFSREIQEEEEEKTIN